MSDAVLGKGLILQIGDGASPEVFASIAEIVELDQTPGGAPDLVDVTNHDSPGFYEEVIPGIIRTKTLKGVANYIGSAASKQNDLRSGMTAGTRKNFRLTIHRASTNKTFIFSAIVIDWYVATPINGPERLNFSLKVTGPDIYLLA